MINTHLPKFWFRKLDQIDKNIMQEFPYVCEIRRENYKHHNEIVDEILESELRDKCAWRASIFYFKNESDAVMFKLKYG